MLMRATGCNQHALGYSCVQEVNHMLWVTAVYRKSITCSGLHTAVNYAAG